MNTALSDDADLTILDIIISGVEMLQLQGGAVYIK